MPSRDNRTRLRMLRILRMDSMHSVREFSDFLDSMTATGATSSWCFVLLTGFGLYKLVMDPFDNSSSRWRNAELCSMASNGPFESNGLDHRLVYFTLVVSFNRLVCVSRSALRTALNSWAHSLGPVEFCNMACTAFSSAGSLKCLRP